MQPGNTISLMRFFSHPGPQAGQRSGADQPVVEGWSAPFLWVLEGWGHGRRNADCGHTPTKPGVSKGGQRPPLWHTALLARCSVLYLLARLTGEAGGRCGMHPACTGRKTGWVFVTGREQKACPFSESGGRYTSPRPSSFVPRWWDKVSRSSGAPCVRQG